MRGMYGDSGGWSTKNGSTDAGFELRSLPILVRQLDIGNDRISFRQQVVSFPPTIQIPHANCVEYPVVSS